MELQDKVDETNLNSKNLMGDDNIEATVSSILSEKMEVQRITRHLLQGRIFLQVEVSMPSDMLIRDAMEVAEAAEKEILKAAPCISQVCIELSLGHPLPVFNLDHYRGARRTPPA